MAACGTRSGYNGGCRCDECRAAAARYQRERMADKPKPTPKRDGKPGARTPLVAVADVPIFDDPPCAGRGSLFFPDTRKPAWRDAVSEAQAICATCPHREPCWRGAAERGERHGVWGGVHMAERAARAEPPSEAPPEPTGVKHGTGRYRKGCRCEICREAASAYQRERLIRKTSPAQRAWQAGIGFPLVLDDPPCAGMVDTFFPDRLRPGWDLDVGLAQAICDTCAHADPCRTAAQERREEWGVWGGWDAYAAGPLRRNREFNERRRARLPA